MSESKIKSIKRACNGRKIYRFQLVEDGICRKEYSYCLYSQYKEICKNNYSLHNKSNWDKIFALYDTFDEKIVPAHLVEIKALGTVQNKNVYLLEDDLELAKQILLKYYESKFDKYLRDLEYVKNQMIIISRTSDVEEVSK